MIDYGGFELLGLSADRQFKEYRCPYDNDIIKIPVDKFYGYCPTCHLTHIDYVANEAQKAFHESSAIFKGALGGYGSGKTTMSCAEITEHILQVPYGRTALVANTIGQVEKTVLKELVKFIDLDKTGKFVKKYNKSKHEWVFKNGHELIIVPSDDEEKMRSLNLTAFYMEEASGINGNIFTQLKARLRNMSAIVKDGAGNTLMDNRLGIVCSNPEDGWLVDDFLVYCNKIYHTPRVPTNSLHALQREKNPLYEAFLSSTRDNIHNLPPGYISGLAVGKSQEWINKYIDCDIATREDLIYPNWSKGFLGSGFQVPSYWLRVSAYDSGWADPTAYLVGAIDQKSGIIYVYEEYYVRQEVLSVHARAYNKSMRGYDLFNEAQVSRELFSNSVRSKKTTAEYFEELLEFPIKMAITPRQVGITKVRDYIETGKIKFFPGLTNLKAEFRGYIRKPTPTDPEAPIEKDDHLMDALRYLIAPLPDNPHDFTEGFILESMLDSVFMERESSRGDEDLGVEYGFDRNLKDEGGIFYYDDKTDWRR